MLVNFGYKSIYNIREKVINSQKYFFFLIFVFLSVSEYLRKLTLGGFRRYLL